MHPVGRRCSFSNTPGILGRRALPDGRLAALGASPPFVRWVLVPAPHGRWGRVPVTVTVNVRQTWEAGCGGLNTPHGVPAPCGARRARTRNMTAGVINDEGGASRFSTSKNLRQTTGSSEAAACTRSRYRFTRFE